MAEKHPLRRGGGEVKAVIAMRERFPSMGTRALRVMLCREGVTLSLATVLAEMPFAVSSLQADSGPECMADFEQVCAECTLPLLILLS